MINMAGTEKKKLGEILLDSGVITAEQLKKALAEQKETKQRLGKTLVELGFIEEKDMVMALAKQLGIPHLDITSYAIKPEVLQMIPPGVAERYQVIPIDKVDKTLTVAMVDPLNVFAIDEIKRITGCNIETVVCMESALKESIRHYYQAPGTVEEEAVETKKKVVSKEDKELELEAVREGAPVVKLVDSIVEQGALERASDIHIEPEEGLLRVRYRIDGVLHEVKTISMDAHPIMLSRIKVLAGLDISEKRVPQDGRFQVKVKDGEIDLRVSTLPTILGEKVAMRLLDKGHILVKLEDLGFLPETLQRFKDLITRPYGIILVTGPTSSGKTTSLYASLHQINNMEKNIITIEDPVEYRIPIINQVQVNVRQGRTFATVLRSVLRQDPNVIMVGEMRDTETARIAIQAALTGHLVFSTIHTNNAPSCVTRLMDMEVEPFLITSALLGVISQRLVRVICPKCKEGITAKPELVKQLGLPSVGNIFTFYHGKGCADCRNTGFMGRTAIFELMLLDDHIKELVMNKSSTGTIRQAARKGGMQTLREDGLQKVLKGITTVEEVIRATAEERD